MDNNIESLLESRGAILHGHFQLTSGRHSDTYVEKFRLLQWPDITSELCRQIANEFGQEVNLVAGPTTGGVILAFETARHLNTRCVIAERKDEGAGREFRRGFQVGPDDSTLVVDDVLTTGGSIHEVLAALEDQGAKAKGVGVLIDRSGGKADFGVPLYSCLTVDAASWDPVECSLCSDGVPLTVT